MKSTTITGAVHVASLKCLQMQDGAPTTALPGIVNSAFASELYFKALVLIESGQSAKGHDLHKLFKLLRPDTRREIESRFDAEAGKTGPRDAKRALEITGYDLKWRFEDVIVSSAQAFVDWRYLYEEGANMSFGLIQLPTVLMDIIIERRPDLKSAGYTLEAVAKI
jgi:hypothetical protein